MGKELESFGACDVAQCGLCRRSHGNSSKRRKGSLCWHTRSLLPAAAPEMGSTTACPIYTRGDAGTERLSTCLRLTEPVGLGVGFEPGPFLPSSTTQQLPAERETQELW